MTEIDEPWLTATETQRVFDLLTEDGHLVYAVGGCVRNALLGEPVTDIDLATSARPETVISLANQSDVKAVPTGIEHGTVTLVVNNASFEVTTFRQDVETDGRRATVSFTTSIEEDARRRDFTMNALYADLEGQILDPLEGLPDLLERRVRFIEDAASRIKEDYLRILRFFRFHAQYGDPEKGMDQEALSAITSNYQGLSGVSAERIGSEMCKLLATPDPSPSVASMKAAGVLQYVLPGADDQWLAPLVHLEASVNRDARAIRRLAVLGGREIVERLRLSRADSRSLDLLKSLSFRGPTIKEIAWRHGATVATDVLLIRKAMAGQPLLEGALDDIEQVALKTCPISASDLLDERQGAALGQALARAEKAWIVSDFSLGRDALIEIALKEG